MLPQFYITMATESENNMKAKEYKNIVEYYYTKNKDGFMGSENRIYTNTKGTTICKAKKCNEPLYNNQSTSNKEYCMRCG